MRDFVALLGTPGRWGAVGELKHAVLTDESGMHGAFGMGVFEYHNHYPEEGALFDRAMLAKARADVAAVLAGYDFSDRELIVDVGGGSGHLLDAILKKSGGRGALFEMPRVAERVAAGMPPFEVVAGDFFTDPLPPGDTYLLMQVVHDWADEEARKILSAARRAAWPGAKLLLIEVIIPENSAPHPAHALDVLMMAVTGGRERTESDYAALMAEADWRLQRVVTLEGRGAIIEGIAA
ncbi:hypothetical protein FY036_01855 [Mesorhizobium microcysteis]|uniref:O-methyltransferase C-terminal domain-containing protein n=1 Tax=Neoaquamicrobium microcysteis TaxID=2682781 RepID=A0A5D4H4P8_9HYPH|nr:methyltransferase [Mesorhizobium microcysteis]TYR35638.1 hypothetical protein FY036_01855 [Mesorhizobium microcysteis]